VRTKASFAISGIVLFTLWGCGGSSGSSATSVAILPKVTINWPDLTRGFEASKFAASARITVTPAVSGGQTALWIVDRPASNLAQTTTYSGTDVKVTGPVAIQVEFFSRSGVTGAGISYVAISGRISADGTLSDSEGNPLGNIASQGRIESIVASGNDPLTGQLYTDVNGSAKAVLSGRMSDGTVVALDQEKLAPRVTSSMTLGSQFASSQGVSVTGIAEGTANVSYTLDGLTASLQVNVSPRKVAMRVLDVQASALSYDPSRGQFWAAFGPTGSNAYGFASVNPTTGAIGTSVSLAGEADLLTVSEDGVAAYAGFSSSGTVKKINLATGTVGSPISIGLEGPGRPTSISINPQNSDEAAVTVKGTASSAHWGPIIIRAGATLPNYMQGPYSDMSRAAYLDSTTLVGASGESSNFPAARATVSATGCSQVASGVSVLPSFGLDALVVKSGQVFTSNGAVFSASTLTTSGQLDFNDIYSVSSRPSLVATDSSNSIVWLLFPTQSGGNFYRIRAVNSNTLTFMGAVTIDGTIVGTPKGLYRFGTKGIAVHTEQGIYAIDNAPGL